MCNINPHGPGLAIAYVPNEPAVLRCEDDNNVAFMHVQPHYYWKWGTWILVTLYKGEEVRRSS